MKRPVEAHTAAGGAGSNDREAALARTRIREVGWPVIVVGLAKAGTTTIAGFFECAGVRTMHWGACAKGVPGLRDGPTVCGQCAGHNDRAGRLPLEGCGNYDVWAQMDTASYMPQITMLPGIHAQYPNATFILNQRSVGDWVSSIKRWANGSFHRKLGSSTAFRFLNVSRSRGPVTDEELALWCGPGNFNICMTLLLYYFYFCPCCLLRSSALPTLCPPGVLRDAPLEILC